MMPPQPSQLAAASWHAICSLRSFDLAPSHILGSHDPLLEVAVELEKAALADDYFVQRRLYVSLQGGRDGDRDCMPAVFTQGEARRRHLCSHSSRHARSAKPTLLACSCYAALPTCTCPAAQRRVLQRHGAACARHSRHHVRGGRQRPRSRA